MSTPVITPNDDDILCGRGSINFEHEGNKKFRVFIAMHLPKYANHKTSRKEKTSLVRSIVEEIKRGKRRFLKKEGGEWRILSPREAGKKVGHALRDATSTMQRHLRCTTPASGITTKDPLVPMQCSSMDPPVRAVPCAVNIHDSKKEVRRGDECNFILLHPQALNTEEYVLKPEPRNGLFPMDCDYNKNCHTKRKVSLDSDENIHYSLSDSEFGQWFPETPDDLIFKFP
eukprot:CAMPEP_0178914350 /NCGR_PEP_ID=MMETSP0786-20121207/11378_1 /TAXON_ID=186022 /ORGANISM="Thalassionema frauenfeldii, Strain CCMP 1798" /LENGTH=228 /DNA_ID=CAMNT_0020587251 /DNA_START=96 /DNA_END=782 /DNA_ORIENTATION=+